MRTVLLLVSAVSLLASCGQVRYHPRSIAHEGTALEPAAAFQEGQAPRPARRRGVSYGDTRARLQLVREDLEYDDLDIDFDDSTDGRLRDFERDRTAFRAEFGRGSSGGFFQIFRERVNAPSLLVEEFTNYGIGGGVIGSPVVGENRYVEFLVPFKFEANVSVGSENVGAFDQDLWYAEANFELGFGARWHGLQPSTGITANSLAALFDSDLPSTPAFGGGAEISGTNFGAYFELLYKHPNVPLMAKVRALVGDVQGVMLAFGFAF